MLSRVYKHFREVTERDKRFIMQLDPVKLDNILWPLFVLYICLNFLDLYTTTLAMTFGPLFREYNPIAAALFNRAFQGFLLATIFKYLPAIPLFYATFVKDKNHRHPFGIRFVKFTALVALVGVDLVLGYIVWGNNIISIITARL